jgi:hypothetical protein
MVVQQVGERSAGQPNPSVGRGEDRQHAKGGPRMQVMLDVAGRRGAVRRAQRHRQTGNDPTKSGILFLEEEDAHSIMSHHSQQWRLQPNELARALRMKEYG